MTTIPAALRRRVRRDGARPLLTFYDLDAGTRTELSAITFANWADKTANLLVGLDVAPGDLVALPLAETDPGHWVTLAITAGAWQAGATIVAHDHPDAAVTVIGPADPRIHDGSPGIILACSLHPLGFGFAEPLAADVIDVSIDLRRQPDQFSPIQVDDHSLAWTDHHRSLSHADLAQTPPISTRRLIRPGTGWPTLRDALVAPLLGNGSTVIAVGTGNLDAIRRAERVTG